MKRLEETGNGLLDLFGDLHHHIALGGGVDDDDLFGRYRLGKRLFQMLGKEAEADPQFIGGQPRFATLAEQKENPPLHRAVLQGGEHLLVVLPVGIGEPLALARGDITEHHPAANGGQRRITADHIAVPGPDRGPLFKKQLDHRLLAGGNLVTVKQGDPPENLGGAEVHPDSGPVFERLGVGGEILELAVEHKARVEGAGRGKDHPPGDIGPIDPLEVDCRAVAGLDLVHRPGMDLNPPDFGDLFARIDP